jgi:hypothetical protein
MKFGEKYELLESLTTGGVETFVANDKIRGERVLVHILECEAQKPNQPTVQWVLEAFLRVAPEPAALVLETGRYSGTLYAYLVSRMPDEAALTNWLRLYKAQGRDTQDIPSRPAKPTAESQAPTASLTPKQPSRVPGAMTPSFPEAQPQAKPGASSALSKPIEQPSQPLPNVKSDAGGSAVHSAPDWDAMTPRSSPANAEPNLSSSPNSFSSAFRPPKFPSETNSPPSKDNPQPGEFTSFFQGPFRAEGPSDIPAVSQQPMKPPRKTVGEFTAMFNSPPAEEPPPAAGVAGNEPAGTGFTGWFNSPGVASRTSGTAGAPASGGLPRPVMDNPGAFPAPPQEPFVPPRPASFVTPPIVPIPTPPIFSIPPLPNPIKELHPVTPPAVSPSDGATYAFNRAVSEAPPSQPAPPLGPSPYTQIISLRPPAGAAGTQNEPSPRAPAVAAASLPRLPAIAPPPMPAMPKIAVPPPPKVPKLDKAAAPEAPASYWPLILTLTVLFFIAVLLVLYFVLKH